MFGMKTITRIAVAAATLPVALPVLGLLGFMATGPTAERRAERILERQHAAWEDREDTVERLHRANPEFDLMWRLFTVLANSDDALAHPEAADDYLALSDTLIRDTAHTAITSGQRHFLLPYADAQPWRQPDAGSLFVDGEVALMIAARRMVRDEPWLRQMALEWNERVRTDFDAAGDDLPESYPNEAWAFCMTTALLALHMSDLLDGTDHSAVIRDYTDRMATTLMDPRTGLIGSDWQANGRALDGTEGSSLWWVSTGLLLLGPDLATAQYEGGKQALHGGMLGMSWAKEWPETHSTGDIDSGPIVPYFHASPASSGFALVAASAHGDDAYRRRLVRALRAADALLVIDPRLSTMAEAPMGDAIVRLGLGFGPLWDAVGAATN